MDNDALLISTLERLGGTLDHMTETVRKIDVRSARTEERVAILEAAKENESREGHEDSRSTRSTLVSIGVFLVALVSLIVSVSH